MRESRAVSSAPLAALAPPSRRIRWRGSLIAILCVALIGGLAWFLTHRSAETPGGAEGARGGGGRGGAPSTVGVATAQQADIPLSIDALGTVTPVANVTVQAQVSGVLTKVLFTEGQMVKRGDVLATIDATPFQLVLAQAQGARIRDEAQLAAARVTLDRYQTLLGQDSIARQEVDTQAALVKQLSGTVAIDRSAENTAKVNLGYARIIAPISGRVGLRPVDAGNVVSPGSASGVATLTQLAPIDVAFAIPQDRVPDIQARLREGAQLPVQAWDRTRTKQLASGIFSTLDNAVDTATGTVKAKARFANAEVALYPNQFVNVRLLLRTVTAAVVVPVTALRHGPNGDFVYVLKDGNTAELRNVVRGEATVDRVSISKGLAVGEQVIAEGGDRLKDGARVQTAAGRSAAAASGAPPDAGSGAASGAHRGRDGRRGGSSAGAAR